MTRKRLLLDHNVSTKVEKLAALYMLNMTAA
jgi:hypothetical protein